MTAEEARRIALARRRRNEQADDPRLYEEPKCLEHMLYEYEIVVPTYTDEAAKLLFDGKGVIDNLEVLDELLDLLDRGGASAGFRLMNGKVVSLGEMRLLRDVFGIDVRYADYDTSG